MISFEIEDIKDFMNRLFKETLFDDFEVVSVEINQGVHVEIDGLLQMDFFDSDEKEQFETQKHIKWEHLKTIVFHVIKGSRTPSNMKIVLTLARKNKLNLFIKSNSTFESDDIHGFYINILFEPNQLKVITGTNYKLFSLDKSIENYFDDSILRFFSKHNIPILR